MTSFIHSFQPICPTTGPRSKGGYHGLSGLESRVDADERTCRREAGN